MDLKPRPWTPPQVAWEKMRQMVGSKTGIVRSIQELETDPDDFSLYSCYGQMTRTTAFTPFQMPQDVGSGNFDRLDAKLAAIGEGIERYSLGAYDDRQFVTASYAEVRDQAIDPKTLILFDESQYQDPHFGYNPFDEHRPMRWVQAYNLTRQHAVLVPAWIVYLSYRPLSPEERCSPSVSTGAAAASTLEEAILKGIYEVVERDALTIMWLARLRVPLIDLGDRFHDLREQLSAFSLDLYVHNITLDVGIPAFWGMLVNREGQKPIMAVGAAANLDPEHALRKVVEEVIQTRIWAKALARQANRHPDFSRPENFHLVDNFDLHVMLYAAYDMRSEVDFLLNAEKSVRMEDLPNHSSGCVLQNILKCVALLDEKGFQVIAVDITSNEIRDAGLASVARVIVPNMQPLNGNHNLVHLGNPRLYAVARQFGIELSPEQVNPYPHPFP